MALKSLVRAGPHKPFSFQTLEKRKKPYTSRVQSNPTIVRSDPASRAGRQEESQKSSALVCLMVASPTMIHGTGTVHLPDTTHTSPGLVNVSFSHSRGQAWQHTFIVINTFERQ